MIYEPAFADQARHLCRLGATDEELAEHFDVCVRTIYRWRNAHEEFAEAVVAGKEHADARVERALYSRAVGCSVERTKVFKHAADPDPVYATYKLHLPPDPNAALQWLRVRQPKKWRIAEEEKGDPGVVELINCALARVADLKAASAALVPAGRPTGWHARARLRQGACAGAAPWVRPSHASPSSIACRTFATSPSATRNSLTPGAKACSAASLVRAAGSEEVMAAIGTHLADPATRFTPCRIARASGHGIGKSALIAMLIKWGLDTGIDTRIVATANTESQLLTKTGPEIVKWHNLSLTRDWFRATATALVSTTPGHERSWRSDLVTWSVVNTEAFAGLHNQGKRIILIFDEASGIAPKVWEVALGALTDEETEIIFLAFGNPTLNTGPFRECFGRAPPSVERRADRQPHGRGHQQGLSRRAGRHLWRGQRHREGARARAIPRCLLDAVHRQRPGRPRPRPRAVHGVTLDPVDLRAGLRAVRRRSFDARHPLRPAMRGRGRGSAGTGWMR